MNVSEKHSSLLQNNNDGRKSLIVHVMCQLKKFSVLLIYFGKKLECLYVSGKHFMASLRFDCIKVPAILKVYQLMGRLFALLKKLARKEHSSLFLPWHQRQ